MENFRFKIAVIGCGAVGSYYGGRLAQAGHEVHFLLRSDYEHVRQHGVRVESAHGDFHVRPIAANNPAAIGPCDLVLVALKTTANDQLPALLPPLIGDRTIVITLQNGLGNEDLIARIVPPERVMGGLCFVCINRVAPGHIRHSAHGLVVLGDLDPAVSPERRHRLVDVFSQAGIRCEPTASLGQARWEKLTWNIPFNGLGVAGCAGLEAVQTGNASRGIIQPCLTTDVLITDLAWLELVKELMVEVIAGGRAAGYPLSDALVETQLNRTRSMGPYKASTLIDFERRLPLEISSMFLEPLRRAQKAGARVPHLERLCKVLTQLESLHA